MSFWVWSQFDFFSVVASWFFSSTNCWKNRIKFYIFLFENFVFGLFCCCKLFFLWKKKVVWSLPKNQQLKMVPWKRQAIKFSPIILAQKVPVTVTINVIFTSRHGFKWTVTKSTVCLEGQVKLSSNGLAIKLLSF